MLKKLNVESDIDMVKSIEFNVDTVYERFNIRRNEEDTLWMYDEIQYTYKEYALELNKQFTDTSNYLKKVIGVNEY